MSKLIIAVMLEASYMQHLAHRRFRPKTSRSGFVDLLRRDGIDV